MDHHWEDLVHCYTTARINKAEGLIGLHGAPLQEVSRRPTAEQQGRRTEGACRP